MKEYKIQYQTKKTPNERHEMSQNKKQESKRIPRIMERNFGSIFGSLRHGKTFGDDVPGMKSERVSSESALLSADFCSENFHY